MKIKSLHPIPKDRKLRVAAYARISNDKEVLETSLAEQIKNYTTLIVQNPNWEFAGIYPDNGKSGSDVIHRKEFIAMIENARLGLIDIILAEERTKSVITAFNKLPNKLESLNDVDYRKLYSRAFVKSKDDILLIVGNKDVSKLNLSTKGELEVEVPYTVRITAFKLRLSVYVNI